MVDLQGTVALVTGGSRGIGRAISVRLAQAGADVAVNYVRHKQAAEEVVRAIQESGRQAKAYRANVSGQEQLHEMFQVLQRDFGRLDILISNAASGVLKPVMELTRHHWDWTMGINATTMLHLVQHAVPMMADRGGKIVAVSSLGSVRAIPNYSAVGSSKAALESFVRHLAVELAPKNINVNIVSAGVVETDAMKHFPNGEEIVAASIKRTPAGRLVTPDDVADVALFLVSPAAKMIHGQTIIVDGGYSIVA